MCYTPITIPNLNYHSKVAAALGYKDTENSKIQVPCKKCSACRARAQSDVLQRVQLESLNSYVFMFTLTYNNKTVPKHVLPGVAELMYPDKSDVTNMFKRIRKNSYFGSRHFKYMVCSEYSPQHARPHYHGLLFLQKLKDDDKFTRFNLESLAFSTLLSEWKRNVATTIAKRDTARYKKGEVIPNTRNPEYVPLCTYVCSYRCRKVRSTYDLHFVEENTSSGSNDVSYYVSKYLFKDSSAVKYIWKCIYQYYKDDKVGAKDCFDKVFKCTSRKSQNFGGIYTYDSYSEYRSNRCNLSLEYNDNVFDYILDMGKISKFTDKPLQFFDIYTGKTMPLCKYFINKLPDDVQARHYKKALAYFRSKPIDVREGLSNASKQAITDYKNRRSQNVDVFDDSLFS